ncbi:MAG: sulfatase-like hydrolase/transferase [Verrucomicrobiae bacterium]|nr:sulfatase-like hydrolase/transferase [Verrucomicrobiae bacterium]
MGKVLCLVAVALGSGGIAAAGPPKPNILVIYTDDHGWADIGAQGADGDVRTPNIDRLVADGVLFKRGYVTAPQCTPSRAAVITGRYQQRFGVEHNGIPMRQDVVTLPERLKGAGYVSGISGKWHLDVEDQRKAQGAKNRALPELAPQHQGFDEYFTGARRDYVASHALDGTPFPDAPRQVRDERCRVVVQTEAALSFLERRAKSPGQPWFLYLAYMAPHVPLESPEPWFSKTPGHLPLERRQALALIGAIDDGVGRIRGALRAMGDEQDTLIFLIGDNGAPLGNAWDGSINLPMVGQKGMLSEGGIRVPFVAAWPGRIPGGQVYEHPVISLDVAATAVAMAGLPRDGALDGVDLIPFLTGQNKGAPHETLYWRWMSQAAIQEFPYKLIALGERERLLFDITAPDGENIGRNLAAKNPDVAARLEGKLKAWCDTLRPPGMPTSFDAHHEGLFGEHGIIAKTERPPSSGPEGSIQGWVCRNGTIAIGDGALVITPDAKAGANARPFLACAALDMPGPVVATVRARVQDGGQGSLSWRTKQQPDFVPENTVAFDWSQAQGTSGVRVELPVQGRLIHVRITAPKGARGLAIQSVELQGKDGEARAWDFGSRP